MSQKRKRPVVYVAKVRALREACEALLYSDDEAQRRHAAAVAHTCDYLLGEENSPINLPRHGKSKRT